METLPRPSPAELAKALQAEVLHRVRAGVIPPNVGSFEELHESCDANDLGGTESLLDRLDAVGSPGWTFRRPTGVAQP